jgi:hypothetical protein
MIGWMAMDVHLVGGDPWWHQVIGPALIAVTAVIAAWIAARTANHRQQEQLLHDRDLQAAQLAYDREQRNRQHVRDTIDSAVRSLDATMRQSAEYQALILTGDEERDECRRIADDEALPDADRAAAIRRYDEAMNEVGAATRKGFDMSTELISESFRLSLRLGIEHPICKGHAAYREAYGTSFEILRNLPTVKMTDEDRKKVKAADAAEGAAMIDFLSSCRSWFESEQREIAERAAR